MKLNKKVELGIKAVNALKEHQGPARIQDIATKIGTTVNFLAQIMRNLRNANIVTVKRGPGGGYTLNAAAPVTAYDVARAVGRFAEGIDAGDTSASNRLRLALVNAFSNTTI